MSLFYYLYVVIIYVNVVFFIYFMSSMLIVYLSISHFILPTYRYFNAFVYFLLSTSRRHLTPLFVVVVRLNVVYPN